MKSIPLLPAHYCLGFVLISLYGTQVCPFIDSLPFKDLTTPILLTFVSLYGIRRLLERWLESGNLQTIVKIQFRTDFLLFVAGGVTLAMYNTLMNDFPAASGLKVLLGMSITGFYIASDLGLQREHRLATDLRASGQHIEIDQSPYPLTKKFAWFSGICLAILGAVVCLVVSKDLVWLIDLKNEDTDLKQAALIVSLEIAFVLIVIVGYTIRVTSSYGSNLRLFFDFQRSTLNRVANGQLTAQVPVASNDEFGVIARHTNQTIETLHARTLELDQMRDVTILALASLAETRDNETGAHILRTQQYVKALAEHLKTHPRFKSVLTPAMIDLLYKTAPLHDSGKVGIPDAILLKPGRLTDDEFEIMKQHPRIGSQAMQAAQSVLGNNSFLTIASEIMDTHHEKWDGSGYPAGLTGEEIPVSGRLMALADVYDALISERIYKAAFSHEKAREIIIDGKNSHFDPDVVDAFIELETKFQEIAQTFTEPKSTHRFAA